MAAYNVCRDPKCATLVEGKVDACPKCGGPMRGVGESPLRGIALLICGLLLIGIVGAIAYAMYPTLTNPGETVDGARFAGTAEQARMVLLLFGAVIVFGLVALANGIYMLVTRQQSRLFLIVSIGLAFALIVVGALTMVSLKSTDEDKPRSYSTF